MRTIAFALIAAFTVATRLSALDAALDQQKDRLSNKDQLEAARAGLDTKQQRVGQIQDIADVKRAENVQKVGDNKENLHTDPAQKVGQVKEDKKITDKHLIEQDEKRIESEKKAADIKLPGAEHEKKDTLEKTKEASNSNGQYQA